jgi:hypothetical protein
MEIRRLASKFRVAAVIKVPMADLVKDHPWD